MGNKYRIVVDTNILFSEIRSANSKLRTVLLNDDFVLLAPNFIFIEIFKHKNKIFKNSKGSEDETYEFLNIILQRIHFINNSYVSKENRKKAFELCRDVDEKDTPFIAISLEYDAKLWTGDERLKKGLVKKGFDKFFNQE